jgi:hypothetical protein
MSRGEVMKTGHFRGKSSKSPPSKSWHRKEIHTSVLPTDSVSAAMQKILRNRGDNPVARALNDILKGDKS